MDLITNQSAWNCNWTANSSIPYIDDWPIAGGDDTKYLLLKATSGSKDMLLALKKFGCTSNYNYLISLYESEDGINKLVHKKDKQEKIEDSKIELLGRSNKNILKDWIIYPNPARNEIIVQVPIECKDAVLEILDYSGKRILRKKIQSGTKNTINLHSFTPGTYQIILKSNTEEYFQRLHVIR